LSTNTKIKKQNNWTYFKKNYEFYLLLLPGLLFIALFKFLPMGGLVIAFKDFNIFDGILASPWVGLEHFKAVFSDEYFFQVFRNTLLISTYKIAFTFPLPIIVAILLNEVKNMTFKKNIQTVIYLPHFLSWVIVQGLFVTILGSTGIVNQILEPFISEPIRFYMDKSLFRSILVGTSAWKEVGWGTIVYLAAITGIDPQLYEAAVVDGANKWKQIIHITIPSITSTIVLMFILRLGYVLEAGFSQVIVMYNSTVYEVADIIGTYVYRTGLGQMNFSYGTAVGIFNSVVAFVLVISGNLMCKKALGKSIW